MDRRTEILRRAAELFERNGVSNTSLEDIAGEIGGGCRIAYIDIAVEVGIAYDRKGNRITGAFDKDVCLPSRVCTDEGRIS